MPLIVNLPAPWALYESEMSAMGQGALSGTVNNSYYIPYVLNAPVTLTGFRIRTSGTPTGHSDVGIYDANGNQLTHTGSTLNVAGIMTLTLGTALALAPGRYYLALWTDSATDLYARFSVLAGQTNAVISNATNAGGLPSTMGGTSQTGFKPMVIGLISGGLA